MGNLLHDPFGLGPNDMPMERWGQVLEHELYQLFPWFKFRFAGFPLFVDDLEILPPDDPRAKPTKDVLDVEIKSNWVPARNKIKAAMRLGLPKLQKFREAKLLRESMVREFMQDRKKQEQNDIGSLIAALAAAGIGGAAGMAGKKSAKGSKGATGDEGVESAAGMSLSCMHVRLGACACAFIYNILAREHTHLNAKAISRSAAERLSVLVHINLEMWSSSPAKQNSSGLTCLFCSCGWHRRQRVTQGTATSRQEGAGAG